MYMPCKGLGLHDLHDLHDGLLHNKNSGYSVEILGTSGAILLQQQQSMESHDLLTWFLGGSTSTKGKTSLRIDLEFLPWCSGCMRCPKTILSA